MTSKLCIILFYKPQFTLALYGNGNGDGDCGLASPFSKTLKAMKTNKRNSPSTTRKEGRMSSYKRSTKARVKPKSKDSATTVSNPINSRPGKICSCGKMFKGTRGLKIHLEKAKFQAPENKLVVSPYKRFVSLQNAILSSCLTFDDSIYYRTSYKTSHNTFIPISNSEKPVTGNKCYVHAKDMIADSFTIYFSNEINQCGETSCRSCNNFVCDQSFKSNSAGKEYKTISYYRLLCSSTNVIYGIHCVHCGLVYVG